MRNKPKPPALRTLIIKQLVTITYRNLTFKERISKARELLNTQRINLSWLQNLTFISECNTHTTKENYYLSATYFVSFQENVSNFYRSKCQQTFG